MKELTKETMHQALEKCLNNQWYRVLIPVQYQTMNSEISHMFEAEKLASWNDNDICRVITYANEFRVEFKNGSFIRTVNASQNARGARAHDIYPYGTIDKRILDTVFAPMLIQYELEQLFFEKEAST